LRKDRDGYVLVTPVERVDAIAEDAPFLAVEMTVTGGRPERILRFRTNVEDWVEAGAGHPIRFEKAAFDGIKPYNPCARRSVGACHPRLGSRSRATR
jgi:hypothetical protein